MKKQSFQNNLLKLGNISNSEIVLKSVFNAEVLPFSINLNIFLISKLLQLTKKTSLKKLQNQKKKLKLKELHRESYKVETLRQEVGVLNLTFVPSLLTQLGLNILSFSDFSIFLENEEDLYVLTLFRIICLFLELPIDSPVKNVFNFMKIKQVQNLS